MVKLICKQEECEFVGKNGECHCDEPVVLSKASQTSAWEDSILECENFQSRIEINNELENAKETIERITKSRKQRGVDRQ